MTYRPNQIPLSHAQMSEKPMTEREWHGCKDSRGHSFVEGVCQTEGCGMDLRQDGDLLGVEHGIPEPSDKELRNKALTQDSRCTHCPPNKGENSNRKPKHPPKPKRKNKR